MAYKLIIAEKPSVAGSIAKVVGANTPHRDKANGYLEGNGYRVTWAFGHLVGLDSPEGMGFKGSELPILPEKWKTHILQGAKTNLNTLVSKQMKTIESLFAGADSIIVATDAGREGELIFRYIYEYLECRKPFDRLWISSLTDEAIRKGMASLRPGAEMDSLSLAAHARSEADWLVGFNASRALRIASGFKGNLSLGRVQTPVLCMICDRFKANRDFVPTPFWQVGATVTKDGTAVPVLSVNRYPAEANADALRDAVNATGAFLVKDVDKKDVTSRPPLLHDLTSLQRIANSKYGMTADDTLRAAQSLYEKKYMSYPRTGSRYVPEDVFKTIPSLIRKVASYPDDAFRAAAQSLDGKKLCRRSVDDAKITDHHALLPTDNVPGELTGNEKKIWELVCGRMLEAFGEDSLAKRTTVTLECANIPFKVTGSVIVKPGWKAVFGVTENDEETRKKGGEEEGDGDMEYSGGQLPDFRQGETVRGGDAQTIRKTDKPLPIYTDSSLLGEMETCGKKIEDEELRESMKDTGLGTPATRAATIETLIHRGYVQRSGKKLLPTDLGMQIAQTVAGRKIADVRTTGEWERELSLMEQGKKSKQSFDDAIRRYVLELNDDIEKNCTSLDGLSAGGKQHTCPACGKPMKSLQYSILCEEGAGGCGFMIPLAVADKKLPGSALEALSRGGTTTLIKGFKTKSGKTFNAKLRFDAESRKIVFEFDAPAAAAPMASKSCPLCGSSMQDGRWSLDCSCGLRIRKVICNTTLSEKDIDTLLGGGRVPKKGLTGSTGKKFDATLVLDKDKKDIVFEFDNRKKKTTKKK